MNKSQPFLLTLILFVISATSNAQIKLPKLISHGIVFQRDVEIPVWGWASPHEDIEIHFNGKTYNTKASAKVWEQTCCLSNFIAGDCLIYGVK